MVRLLSLALQPSVPVHNAGSMGTNRIFHILTNQSVRTAVPCSQECINAKKPHQPWQQVAFLERRRYTSGKVMGRLQAAQQVRNLLMYRTVGCTLSELRGNIAKLAANGSQSTGLTEILCCCPSLKLCKGAAARPAEDIQEGLGFGRPCNRILEKMPRTLGLKGKQIILRPPTHCKHDLPAY